MRPFRPLLALAVLFAFPRAVTAQAPFEAEPGDPIEIAAPTLDPRLVPATLTERGPTWIAFSLDGGQVWTRHLYRVDEIRVRRPVPVRSRLRWGAAWGVFLGSSLGGIAGPFVARGVEGENSPWKSVGISAGVGALTGAGIGALIGAVVPRSRWTHYRFRE